MRILITGASSRLGRAIAEAIAHRNRLRLMDETVDAGENDEAAPGSILDPDDAWRAVRDVDALIHTGEPPPDLPNDESKREELILDLATRGTHVLFSAAVAAGVKRLIYAGSLEIFSGYSEDVHLSEQWKPLPPADVPRMSRYLGELVCREFAREHAVTVTCLRLGKLVLEEEVRGRTPDPTWLDVRDAAAAFRWALDRDAGHHLSWLRRWAIFHICADHPNPRFLIDHASHRGFRPEHNFQQDDAL